MQKSIESASPSKTTKVAEAFSVDIANGDTILLNGTVGAGKSHFARSLITKLMQNHGTVESVPSPTFTLVQNYSFDSLDVWHADLYRLGNVDELYELGLEEAFDTSVCLVEWSDRLGQLTPENALTIHFEILNNETRHLLLEWTDPKWDSIIKSLPK